MSRQRGALQVGAPARIVSRGISRNSSRTAADAQLAHTALGWLHIARVAHRRHDTRGGGSTGLHTASAVNASAQTISYRIDQAGRCYL